MKILSYLIIMVMITIMISCTSSFKLNDRNQTGYGSSDTLGQGFSINGRVTNPERVITATGRYYVSEAQAKEIEVKAKADSALTNAVAYAIRNLTAQFKENPQSIGNLEGAINALAMLKYAESTDGNRYGNYSRQAVGFEMRRQMLYEESQMIRNRIRARRGY